MTNWPTFTSCFLESGDHETLIQLDADSFQEIMSGYRHFRFSNQAIH